MSQLLACVQHLHLCRAVCADRGLSFLVQACYQLCPKAVALRLETGDKVDDRCLCARGASAEKAVRMALQDQREAGLSKRRLMKAERRAAKIKALLDRYEAPRMLCIKIADEI